MKKKLFSKMVAMATTTVLVLGSSSLTVFAADDGTAADGPNGDANATKQSSGVAEATWDTTDVGATGFNVIGDDDATATDGVDTETDISIWAKVVEHGDIVYKVDIAWGAMKFEFNNQAGKWNTETHRYDAAGGVSAEWTEEDYIDATNNKITVVNHSNWAVDTKFTYAHDGAAFNAEATGANAVRGHFFLDNADAVKASKVLVGSTSIGDASDELEADEVLTLGHQDKANKDMYGGVENGESLSDGAFAGKAENTDGSCTRHVYFAFNGTPDIANMDDALKTDFTKVGVITVTIEPYEP